MRRLIRLVGLAALVALGSDKALTGAASKPGRGDQWQFRLRLAAPEPSIQSDPDHPELGMVARIPTFGLRPAEGRAAASATASLPVKVVRVAIPEGAGVSLESIRTPRRLLKGVRLGPVEAQGQGWPGPEAGPTAAPESGESLAANSSRPPRAGAGGDVPIRLGQIGYLRSQKFVEVLYTPLLPVTPDASARRAATAGPADLEFYPEVEADLRVTGVDWDRVAREAAAAPSDPHFEDAYRAALFNYQEGLSFRTQAPEELSHVAAGAGATPTAGASAVSALGTATTPIYRVVIRTTGIHRLTWSYLLAPGTGVAPGLTGTPSGAFKLMNQGIEVPIRVVDGGDNTFDPPDYIEFFGEGMLDEPELKLNYDDVAPFPDIFQANDVTDENVYFLFGEPGVRSRIPDLPSPFQAGPPLETSFLETIHREFDTRFVPNGTDDPFYQGPPLIGNTGSFVADPNASNCGYTNTGAHLQTEYLGPGFGSTSIHYCQACDLALPDPLSIPDPATIRVRLRGATSESGVNPDHMSVVQVGTGASSSSTRCWDGEALVVQTVSVPQSLLAGGAGVYVAQPGLSATVGTEGLYMDWIEVDYRRALRLNNRELRSRTANADRTLDVGGFPTNVPADLIVYDISRTVGASPVRSPRRITGGSVSGSAGNFTLRFTLVQDATLPGGAPRLLAAAGDQGFRLPVRVEEVTGEDLTDPNLSADMIVVTTPDAADATPGSNFMDYLAHREIDSGILTRVVMMRDVYDHFSFGIETPEALRSFLSYAFTNWRGTSGTAAPPSYVMLVGDISLDYKNLLGQPSWINQVPTFVMYSSGAVLDYYASDTYIAAFRGADQLPDIHIGRVSTRTQAESETVFGKLMDYDLNPPSGSWRAKGLFLADRGTSQIETNEFENLQTSAATTHFVSPFSNDRLFYHDPAYGNGTNPGAWRADFVSRMDSGAALTSYVGHGSFAVWGLDSLFVNGDLALLSPTQKPTMLVNENCLVGGFHFLGGDSLGEAFLKTPGKGAVSVFAPTGLQFSAVYQQINDALYAPMFGLTKERRFGNLITEIRLGLDFSIGDLQAYTLLGDPAQRLILPAPRPPIGFSAATGQNARVVLGWSPGPDTGVVTRIYRAAAPGGPYTLLTPAGVTGTSYEDKSVVNGRTYFYRATSVDPNGPFEGGVTNLNADCNLADLPASGPGCVWARPLNPNPPAIPVNFRVFNPGTGGQLEVAWNATVEPDLSFYTASYGIDPGGPYTLTLQVPAPATGAVVTNLVNGTRYFVIVTATNLSGRTSAPAPEGTGIPGVFEGINPPDIIGDLDVRRSASLPDSIELLWNAPPFDIYGGPVAVASFSIYRSTNPFFIPGTSNRIAVISDPNARSFIDPGAFVAPQNYYYLVTVTDTRGFVSGAGRQLPDGVSDLRIVRNGGNLDLSWSAVTRDVDGNPTLVDHYELYADAQPVDRARVGTLAPAVPFIATTSVSVPAPAGAVYYSVIVVDVRGNRSPF